MKHNLCNYFAKTISYIGIIFGLKWTLSVLERHLYIKNQACKSEKVWSESFQSQLKDFDNQAVTFFTDSLGQEAVSIKSVIKAIGFTVDLSQDPATNSDYEYEIKAYEFRDFWEFMYFISGSIDGTVTVPGSISDNQIAVKTIIDGNKNFHCDQFMQFLFDEYEKVQPFEVDFGDYSWENRQQYCCSKGDPSLPR